MRTSANRQYGLTIVELMIAMALSLLLGIGVFQVYQANNASARLTQSLSEVQEVGRLASELMVRDIRNADYWGCAGNMNSMNSTIDPDGKGYDPVIHGFAQPGQEGIVAFNDVAAGTKVGANDVITDTDILELRSLVGQGLSIQKSMNIPSAVLFLTKNTGYEEGDVLAVTDCQAGDVFQVTNFNAAGGGTPGYNIVHNKGKGSPGNFTDNLSKQYDKGAQILLPSYRTYFLSKDADSIPRLMMRDESGASNVLADWVEDMQLVFGADSDGDGIVDTFGDADELAAAGITMDQVLSIRVSLRVASRETNVVDTGIAYSWNGGSALDTSVDQGRLRRVFTTNASVRSRLP